MLAELDRLARELDNVSKALVKTEQLLEPVEEEYGAAIEAKLVALHDAALKDGSRVPRQEIVVAMARAEMPEQLRKNFDHLVALRRRGERRLSGLKATVDAQRSILSALKAELEATG